jgi:hypothetical protein
MAANNKKTTYLGNNQIKKDGVEHFFTKDEIAEYVKCTKDPIYFANNYIKVIAPSRGLIPYHPYPYQEKMFDLYRKNRFVCVLSSRQSGKSISSVIFILWYAIFHPEKTIGILANKGSTAREMLSRITLALENLPFFLQPGCKVLNKGSIVFSTNTKILAAATSGASVRGLSLDLAYLDEFAFVNRANEFYTSTYPVISAGTDTKVIITSTANGVGNLFHSIYQGAVAGSNGFIPFRVDWWDVPGRDQKWKDDTIANTSELQFAQEYSNEFLGRSSTLLSSDALLGLKGENPIESRNEVSYYKKPLEDHTYIMCVDVSKGRGKDYSTFNVIDVTDKEYEQVCVFRDNMISPLLFPDIIVKVANAYNEALVVIENNDVGHVVCNIVYHEYEYENTFVESCVNSAGIGVSMNKKIKRIGCSNLKDIVEMGKLKLVDFNTIAEMTTFEASGTSYSASDGNHDDLVMNLVMFAWFMSSSAFGHLSEDNIRSMLFQDRMREMEDDLVPFGFINDGRSNGISEEANTAIRQQKEWNSF